MENNTIIYYDDKGNELARLVFDTRYCDIERIDMELFKPMSKLFPVDNSSFDCCENCKYCDVYINKMEDNDE